VTIVMLCASRRTARNRRGYNLSDDQLWFLRSAYLYTLPREEIALNN